VFMTLAAIVGLAALVIFARYLWFYLAGEGAGHVQSLILGSMLFLAAVQLAALGVIGDVLAGSRVLQQRVLERVRRVELELGVAPSHYEPGAPRAADGGGPADGSADTAPRAATEDGAQAAADERARPAPTTGADAGPATGKTEEREALRL
jgi:hypothetical protein